MNSDRTYYSHDAEMHAMRERAVLTLIFPTFGLAIGAVLALLLAPRLVVKLVWNWQECRGGLAEWT